jgi:hypothetical protein
MKTIVQLAYAQVPNRLYALCDDGNLYWRNETGRADQPWIRDGGIPEDPAQPVIRAPEMEVQPDLPLAPAQETGLAAMLGGGVRVAGPGDVNPFKGEPVIPVEVPASQSSAGSPAFIAPGSIAVESQPAHQASPILPQK